MMQFGKILIGMGIVIVVLGLLLTFGSNIPLINKLGHLPGDIVIKRDNFVLYIPWVTCLAISLAVYIFMRLIHR